MGRPVVHFELWSRQPEQLDAFFSQVFDWQISDVPELQHYRLIDTGGSGGIGGGIMTPQEGPWPGNMCLYIDVDDLEAYCERIRQAGGKIVVERMDVPGVGALALFEDPDGRVLGLWQKL